MSGPKSVIYTSVCIIGNQRPAYTMRVQLYEFDVKLLTIIYSQNIFKYKKKSKEKQQL